MVSLRESFSPTRVAVEVWARTTSRLVTPKTRFGLNTFLALRISAAIGTVEFTGLEMMRRNALGQCSATPVTRSLTMPALILNRSSRVMPGFPGIVQKITQLLERIDRD